VRFGLKMTTIPVTQMLFFSKPSEITSDVASITAAMAAYLAAFIPADSILKGGEEFEDVPQSIREIGDQDIVMTIVDFLASNWYYCAHRRYRLPMDKSVNIAKFDKQDVVVENTSDAPIWVYIITRVANKDKNVLPPIMVAPGQSKLF
jgi:hypothetical protein